MGDNGGFGRGLLLLALSVRCFGEQRARQMMAQAGREDLSQLLDLVRDESAREPHPGYEREET